MITLTDPRTELVQCSADDVEHMMCSVCWVPGQPMFCGEPDFEGEECPGDCSHAICSMCDLAWQSHLCEEAAR